MIQSLVNNIDENFAKACQLLNDCPGKVIVMGMGKSGRVAGKIAATFASTGTPAFFVHPGEASHGDMGMIRGGDVVLMISSSGNTPEVVSLLPFLHKISVPVVSITCNKLSILGKGSDVCIEINIPNEACHLNLAPTTSTTASLVIGDALALSLSEYKGFTSDDFAFSHPGGVLERDYY